MYLLSDVNITGVNAVVKQVIGAAITAAKVTAVEELPERRGSHGHKERRERRRAGRRDSQG